MLVGCVISVGAIGCERSDPTGEEPFHVERVMGRPGRSLGQFGYPRAIDVDQANGFVYVIDKSARVQRYGIDGTPHLEWQMPAMENGKPTGISVDERGMVWVADTHYFRIMAYDAEGHEQLRFGSFGRGDGQFIYNTDVAFGPDGRLYVAEYGGNDRIQVFDASGQYLFQFGSFGPDAGQFNRPQSLTFNRDRTELFIADACNHRIVVTDPLGKWLRYFGTPGAAPGEFSYPYSVEMLPDGSIMVAEFGNNRIQRLDAEGNSLAVYGRLGRAEGELQYPWATAATDDELFVLDSGNNRVQVMHGMW
jgi:DNA-binding beta-propeller fold protein YncE